MAVERVLFITQEIAPYVPETPMSVMGNKIPRYIQENGCEIRTFLPKWGIINERRGQLHEVIRLSGMNIIINDTDHPLLIKVASMQPSRIQVYFIDNDDFFRKRQMAYDENGAEYPDNYERAIFYARSVIETTKLLRWFPDIVQCQGWMSMLIPFYLKNAYKDEPTYASSKIVLSLHNQSLETPLPQEFVAMLAFRNVTPRVINSYKMPFKTYRDFAKFCILFCDGIVCSDEDIDPELIEFAQNKNIPLLPFSKEDFPQKVQAFYNSLHDQA
ncbi:MAG: glycogen/starch synthase [Bacteroidaceae bacterium]|nr:glycogen/starch synthase [Bacteroidaceae bacterium]